MKATEPLKKKKKKKKKDIIANANAQTFLQPSSTHTKPIKKKKKSYAQPRHSLIIYYINKIQITNPT
jgi:hypothetical protein